MPRFVLHNLHCAPFLHLLGGGPPSQGEGVGKLGGRVRIGAVYIYLEVEDDEVDIGGATPPIRTQPPNLPTPSPCEGGPPPCEGREHSEDCGEQISAL